MHYTIAPTPTGRWSVGPLIPGTNTVRPVLECPTQASAQEQADAHNAERERIAQLEQHFAATPPRWRHTQPGPRAQHASAYARCRSLPEAPL
jgi:hypothetical protein